MEFTLGQVAAILQGKVEGDENQKVSRLDKIQEGKPGGISFLANEKYTPFIYETEATAVIVSKSFVPTKALKTNLIKVEDAYNGFTMLLEAYSMMMKNSIVGVEEPSFMDASSQIGEQAYRGAFSYIGKSCKIGDSVKIYSHVHIGDRVQIGNNSIIHAGAKICADTIIGDNCEIHPGAVIGSDGFGFAPQEDGTIGAKTGIIKSIKKAGDTHFGYIGIDMKNFLKSYSIFKNLEGIEDRLRELEKKQ